MSATSSWTDVHVKRPFASVSATVDKGKIVVQAQESYIKNARIDQRIPMREERVVCGASQTHKWVPRMKQEKTYA